MGALIPLALTLAPEIGRWLFGEIGEIGDRTTAAVSAAIQAATGTIDPEAAAAVLHANPAAAGQLRLQLARLAAEQERIARLADINHFAALVGDAAEARNQAAALSGQKGAVAWSAPIISAAVLLTFGFVMLLVLTRGVPAGSETVANMLLGTLAAMATSVVSYWVGSSAGSARKEERLAQVGRSQ